MIITLVLLLALAGALLLASQDSWVAGWGLGLPQRVAVGALGGAIFGLLLVPLLGLVAAVLLFALSLCALVLLVVGVVFVARLLSGRRP